jgi:hypothetical protein
LEEILDPVPFHFEIIPFFRFAGLTSNTRQLDNKLVNGRTQDQRLDEPKDKVQAYFEAYCLAWSLP